jgi:uncharacterized membrane-anchored protein
MKATGILLAACALAAPTATFAGDEKGAAAEYRFEDGPKKLALGHDLELALPEGFRYLDPKQSRQVLEKMGNFHNESILGIVVPADEKKDYFVTIDYADEGFVKDDDEIDKDAILDAMKEGQEEANKERVRRGFEPLVLDGWAEPPSYDKASHHLVWALRLHDSKAESINFPTRILGRKGYVRVNLVCGPENFAASKADMPQLLAATAFAKGAQYGDFNPSTDKVAEVGLVALITGGVALKLVKVGLLAKFWSVIVAGALALKKALVLLVVGALALVRRLFRRKPPADEVAVAAPGPAPHAPPAPEDEPPAT